MASTLESVLSVSAWLILDFLIAYNGNRNIALRHCLVRIMVRWQLFSALCSGNVCGLSRCSNPQLYHRADAVTSKQVEERPRRVKLYSPELPAISDRWANAVGSILFRGVYVSKRCVYAMLDSCLHVIRSILHHLLVYCSWHRWTISPLMLKVTCTDLLCIDTLLCLYTSSLHLSGSVSSFQVVIANKQLCPQLPITHMPCLSQIRQVNSLIAVQCTYDLSFTSLL